eukprot:CAMPEP_0113331322 /NCGR_PEP_ID=MMETSP0010_2-20120614/22398_1 /TAXON_ID=216773 ORGANISM="Corethron hystrix, Strain 308" /NCGR_SAMPLE_ID=MMETSP0010_2 /ASSEMBLY_ACC=CAM_ASM_000155 /LENGTH=85 /DNA_ID=CAMNT_0000194523 /DNA_START=2003 /DNA_END=2261 /DNA_ORIENTATION=+ /assembly_acc=CAM_ASM_000155
MVGGVLVCRSDLCAAGASPGLSPAAAGADADVDARAADADDAAVAPLAAVAAVAPAVVTRAGVRILPSEICGFLLSFVFRYRSSI